MVEPTDLVIVERSKLFMPTDKRMLVFVASKFDCLQEKSRELAEKMWEFTFDNELKSDRLAANKAKIPRNDPIREQRQDAIREKFTKNKDANIAMYEA